MATIHHLLLVLALPLAVAPSEERKHAILFEKFDAEGALRPIGDKMAAIGHLLDALRLPNLASPPCFWERLKEKKEHVATGAHVAIFGGGQEFHDYPFAYRKKT